MHIKEGKRNIAHYNLDIIIAIGYRVQSDVAVRFRHWATQRLHEYIQKGFTMDDEQLRWGSITTNAKQNFAIFSPDIRGGAAVAARQ